MRVLISGFEPFGNHGLNPTALLIDEFNGNRIQYPSTLKIQTILLPVTFEDAFTCLNLRIEEFNPDVVICFGLAAGRAEINLEFVAQNIIDAEIQDNAGVQPKNTKIIESGHEMYHSTLPVQGLEGALQKAGIPVKISNSAGKYVCNYLFYRLMESNQDTERLCGFVHVPLLPEQTIDKPTLSLESLKKALSVMLEYIDY